MIGKNRRGKEFAPTMPSISDRLTQAQQEFKAVVSTIPFDEDAVDSAPTLHGLTNAFKDIVDIAGVPTTCDTNVDMDRLRPRMPQ